MAVNFALVKLEQSNLIHKFTKKMPFMDQYIQLLILCVLSPFPFSVFIIRRRLDICILN